ncbi:MAG: hypothetical protein ACRYF4_02590 [Janthinobacterium lividum]
MVDKEVGAIEEALRSSLQHVAAPAGFNQRVQARIAQRAANQQVRTAPRVATAVFSGGSRRMGWWTAIAAMLALSAGADVSYLRHERQQAAQAKVDYAMQLTTHALDEVEMGVNRSSAGRFAQLRNETSR